VVQATAIVSSNGIQTLRLFMPFRPLVNTALSIFGVEGLRARSGADEPFYGLGQLIDLLLALAGLYCLDDTSPNVIV